MILGMAACSALAAQVPETGSKSPHLGRADALGSGVSWGSGISSSCVQGAVQQPSPSNPRVGHPRK